MLPSRINLQDASNDPEDIFSSALSTIFPDDTVNSHGTPGSSVIYRSPLFGDINLQIPRHPDEEQGRKLFAHHLWNAGVVVADAVEAASRDRGDNSLARNGDEEEGKVFWDPRYWDMRGRTVLEIGAGTALPSLVSALVGAKSVTITDHPSSPALTTNAIEQNLKTNVKPPQVDIVSIYGYVWGTSTFYSPHAYGKPTSPPSSSFDRIIIADCLWMPSQHINLIKTILTFLPEASSPASENQPSQPTTTPNPAIKPLPSRPCALLVAGFHTGRRIVSSFFSLATEPLESTSPSSASTLSNRPVDPPWHPHSSNTTTIPTAPAASGTDSSTTATTPAPTSEFTDSEIPYIGKLRLASIFEIDVNLNTRPWQSVRESGTKWDAKRWCVVGVLVRR